MDFIGISTWIFDALVLKALPIASVILLLWGLFGIVDRLPDTVTRQAEEAGRKISRAFRRK